MRFIRAFIGLVAAILFTVFAVANRQEVEIVWSPTAPSAHLPLYLVALGMLAAGFILGALLVWLNTLHLRWEKAQHKRQVKRLEKEIIDYKIKNPAATSLGIGVEPVIDPFHPGMDKPL